MENRGFPKTKLTSALVAVSVLVLSYPALKATVLIAMKVKAWIMSQ